jgi:hypothetical protein
MNNETPDLPLEETAEADATALPPWAQEGIATGVLHIKRACSTPEQHAILLRLETDPLVPKVWRELTKRKRPSGEFFYPAKRSAVPKASTQIEAQAEALARTLWFAFCAARDRITVSKSAEVDPTRAKLLHEAAVLRDVAQDLFKTNTTNPQTMIDVAALCRAARWREKGANALRQADDPLMVTNERGDPVLRGTSIVISNHLIDFFGTPLYRSAATLAAVALGQSDDDTVTMLARAARSAFSRQNPTPRS